MIGSCVGVVSIGSDGVREPSWKAGGLGSEAGEVFTGVELVEEASETG